MECSGSAELTRRIRSHVHTLSSLLTGISASLYCCKMAGEQAPPDSHMDEAQQLAEEAERELASIREILRELDAVHVPESDSSADSI